MAHPSPKLVDLARRIVEQEAGESPDQAASAAAVQSACRKLQNHLVDLLGAGGVLALLKRALHLAKRQQPLLAKVAVSEEPAACFAGLAESLEASSVPEAAVAATMVLAHTLELLVMLLGEELGMKPIHKIWPQATSAREIDK